MSDTKNYFPITSWNESDRPREKYLAKGKQALSNAELLAILIGSGSRTESAVTLCQKMLQLADNNLNTLSKWTTFDLMQLNGIGEAKALAISAAMELGKRTRLEDALEQKKISNSKAAFEILQPLIGDLPHEEFWVIYLNNANKVMRTQQISKGGITGTLVDVRMVFREAFQLGAVALIMAHNHPSGSITPSKSDEKLTVKLQKAGEQLDIRVLDHLVITSKTYYSFGDEGLL